MATRKDNNRNGDSGSNPMDALEGKGRKPAKAKRTVPAASRKSGSGRPRVSQGMDESGMAGSGNRSRKKVVKRRRIRPRAYLFLAVVLGISIFAGMYLSGFMPGQRTSGLRETVSKAGGSGLAGEARKDFMLLVKKGDRLYDSRRFEEAAHWYEKALGMRPADPSIMIDLGTCFYYQGSETKALKCYDDALNISPKEPRALFNKGIVLRRMGRYEECRDSLRAYLKTGPSESDAARVRDMLSRID